MARSLRCGCVIALLTCLSTGIVYADHRDSYRKAIQARNRGRWAEVARYMREAIAEQPKETGERINISGMDFVPYVPHYYLGLALFNTGDCVGALASWRTSESQGAVQRLSEGSNLVRVRKECETRVAAAKPATPPGSTATAPPKAAGPDPAAVNAAAQTAESAIKEAERIVGVLQDDAPLSKIWSADPALAPSAQRASDTLTKAREEWQAGRRESNVNRLQQAATLATQAAQLFDDVRRKAEIRREDLKREAAAAAAAEAAAARAADKAAERAEELRPPVAPSSAAPVPREVEPDKSPENLSPAAKPFIPPPALLGAARLFFGAKYQEAAASLAAQRYRDRPAAAQVALLQAASLYSLYLVGAERDAKLLEQARAAAAESRRLAPALQPDPRAFSPRFVAFYASSRR